MGVLAYDSELLRRLKAGDHLTAGEEEEAEIRGCSIWAVEVGSSYQCVLCVCACVRVWSVCVCGGSIVFLSRNRMYYYNYVSACK